MKRPLALSDKRGLPPGAFSWADAAGMRFFFRRMEWFLPSREMRVPGGVFTAKVAP